MEHCDKCSKEIENAFITAYGERRCEDCYNSYLMTDRGKVEYFIGIARGEYSINDFDAVFLDHLTVCWQTYHDKLAMRISEIKEIEDRAYKLGLI